MTITDDLGADFSDLDTYEIVSDRVDDVLLNGAPAGLKSIAFIQELGTSTKIFANGSRVVRASRIVQAGIVTAVDLLDDDRLSDRG